MITEIAVLHIKKEQSEKFETAFHSAQKIIVAAKGYIHHTLLKCIDEAGKYLLIVKWQAAEDHTEGFRKSIAYNEWKKLLHHFYEPFPKVEHYTTLNL